LSEAIDTVTFWSDFKSTFLNAFPWLVPMDDKTVDATALKDKGLGKLEGFSGPRLWLFRVTLQETDLGGAALEAFVGWRPKRMAKWVYKFVIYTSFRGVPPGQESTRTVPALYMGPTNTAELGEMDKRIAKLLERTLRVPLKDRVIPGISRPITIRASYSNMEASLSSPDWLARYARWEAMSVPKGMATAPIMSGAFPALVFSIGVDTGRPVNEYLSLVNDFMQVVNAIEEGFDAPSLALVPLPYKRVGIAPTWDYKPIFFCKPCNRFEDITAIGWKQNPQWCNYRSDGCKRAIFKDPGPP
jgi:hypothetical protein